jgi:hypothetical protein
MRHRLLLSLSLVCLSAWAQPAAPPVKLGPLWRLLAGEWTGEAATGVRSGSCSFRFDLGDHILIRTNHAEVPVGGNGQIAIHDDFMVIYPGPAETQARATYWDNEGHIIEYVAEWSAGGTTLTFLSKPAPGPQFRLTYKKVDSDTFTVSFDMAPPGPAGVFKPYTSGTIKRQKG